MWPGKEIKYSDDLTYKLYRSDPSEVDAWKVGNTTSDIIQDNKPKETLKEKQ